MPTRNITVMGISVPVNVPYVEGHTLTAVEASVLNQTFGENIRNNTANRVKEILADESKSDSDKQKEVTEYVTGVASEYSFANKRSGGARITDPVEREARKLAAAAVDAALKAQGKSRKDVDKDALDRKIAEAAKSKTFQDRAKRIVEQSQKEAAQLDLSDL